MCADIFYACIARKGTLVVSATIGAVAGSTMQTIERILASVDAAASSKRVYADTSTTFSYVTENGVCYLCVASNTTPRRICFALLEHLRAEYVARGTLSKAFLRGEMEFFSSNANADKLRDVQAQVDDVKETMLANIDRLLTRGEKLEQIDARTDDLAARSGEFARHGSRLRCALLHQNIKLSIAIVTIVIFMLIIAAIVIYLIVRKAQS